MARMGMTKEEKDKSLPWVSLVVGLAFAGVATRVFFMLNGIRTGHSNFAGIVPESMASVMHVSAAILAAASLWLVGVGVARKRYWLLPMSVVAIIALLSISVPLGYYS